MRRMMDLGHVWEFEQRFGSFEIWFFVLWEVGAVILGYLNMALILISKRNIRNIWEE